MLHAACQVDCSSFNYFVPYNYQNSRNILPENPEEKLKGQSMQLLSRIKRP